MEDSYREGNKVFGLLKNVNAAFLTLSYSSLRRAETRNALVFGWVACEQVVEQFWVDIFLKDKKAYRTAERRKRLKNLQNVAQKIEILMQASIISKQTYEALSAARRARNDFAHKGGPVAFDAALQCITGLLLSIQEFAKIKGVSTSTAHLLEVFETREEKTVKAPDAVDRSEEIDWSRVKFWREVYKIPGDENWEGDDSLVDGIELKDATGRDDPPESC